MPDGFDPHVELNRIYSLAEAMRACKQRIPIVMSQMDAALADPETTIADKFRIWDMIWNRAYGKPRQTVYINDETSANQSSSRVKVYLPDNGRVTTPVKVIDSEAA
jgi:hypothetical protein